MKKRTPLAPEIRRLWEEGKLTKQEIADRLGCKFNYVCVTISLAKRPGYAAEWMARKRETDPQYYARELKWQRDYSRRKREERT